MDNWGHKRGVKGQPGVRAKASWVTVTSTHSPQDRVAKISILMPNGRILAFFMRLFGISAYFRKFGMFLA